MRPTIYDVARRAGVSLATVSRVVNRGPYVREETRRRVMEAITELGYEPSLVASALMKKSLATIGLILPDITNPFFAEIARGVEDEGSRLGYSVFICNSDEQGDKEASYIRLLRRKSCDGVIMAAAALDDPHFAHWVQSGYPIVMVARQVDGVVVDTVVVDDFKGGYLATQYLLELGHRRIAFLGEGRRVASSRERQRGYSAALTDFGVEPEPQLVLSAPARHEPSTVGRFLQSTGGVTAVFAANDVLAISVLKAARQVGRVVPDELAVVGFDRTILASMSDPELTSVAQPMTEMGRLAMELLVRRINDPAASPVLRTVQPQLVIGGSTAPPKSLVQSR